MSKVSTGVYSQQMTAVFGEWKVQNYLKFKFPFFANEVINTDHSQNVCGSDWVIRRYHTKPLQNFLYFTRVSRHILPRSLNFCSIANFKKGKGIIEGEKKKFFFF